MTLLYLDTETTGLDANRHHVWEIAWAVGPGPIQSAFVSHDLITADPSALAMNGYWDRCPGTVAGLKSFAAEELLQVLLNGATVVGANPAFDTAFLSARWGKAPWHYRLLDIESMAIGVMPNPGTDKVPGLKTIASFLRDRGHHDIPEPDHTAAGDVATLRGCHLALVSEYT